MLTQNQVGPVATTSSIAAGSLVTDRAGNMGEKVVSELQSRYYENSYRRNRFSAAVNGQVTTVGLATTYTGLCLSNPVGSTVNVVLDKAGWAQLVAAAAAAGVGLMYGYNSSTNVTHTTPVTPKNNFVGVGASGTALVDSAATLPTAPTLQKILGSLLTGAITTVPGVPVAENEVAGSIILPPGAYVAFYTSAASGAAGMSFSFEWTEVPV